MRRCVMCYTSNGSMDLIHWLRSKKKSYWRKLVADRIVNLTFWVQERGDRSLAVGLLAGIAIVLFFRLIFILLVLLAVVGSTAYLFAEDD